MADKLFSIPKTPETVAYDADGNLTEDGLWSYTYNAKNQLTQMKSKIIVSQSGYYIINDFVYDYMGRLASKTVTTHEGYLYGNPVNPVGSMERYVYNGWNIIAVIHDSGGIQNLVTYTWGIDLTGTSQGAGGVGGLIAIEDERTGGTYSIAQDGNGNIAAVIDLSSKSIVAEFEYSPYGEVIRQSGAYSDKMPFRFSTKWYDENTNLYNYGLRFYDPENGRFINRDLIGEVGGINLYAFVGNDPVNKWDYLGMSDIYTLDTLPVYADDGDFYTLDAFQVNVDGDPGFYKGPAWGISFEEYTQSVPGYAFDSGVWEADQKANCLSVGLDWVDGKCINLKALEKHAQLIFAAQLKAAQLRQKLALAQGRDPDLQYAGDGVGPILNRVYSADINTGLPAEAIMAAFAADPNTFTDTSGFPWFNSPFSSGGGGDPVIEVGSVLNIDGPLLVNPSVKVTAVSDLSVTFTTMKGHPEAGFISFSASQIAPGRVGFQINSTLQAATPLDRGLYNVGGRVIQTKIWMGTLNAVIRYSGGSGSTHSSTTIIPPGGG